jgi:transposase InsO family protein/cbb3-type cytochrome oxidase subunit 3
MPNAIYHPDPENPKLAKGEICYIEVTDDKPIIARPRRYNWVQKAFLTAKTSIMIRQGKLEISEGDYASALVLVPYEDRIKKSLDKWGDKAEEESKKPENFAEVATWFRMCCDFRELNSKTISEVFPLPRIDDLIDEIPLGTKYYSLGDVFDAFFCIELAQKSRKYTGFRTHDQHLQYKVMPQGGKNNPSRFCRAISKMFGDIYGHEALKYMDDILIHSKDFETHYNTLAKVYNCLIVNQLTFKLAKLHLGYNRVRFLGHLVDERGRSPDFEGVRAVSEIAYPKNSATEVRHFLGLTVYYKDYIENYSAKAMPLYELTQKGVNVAEMWAKNPEKYEKAVDELKMALISEPCLRPPDNTRKFRIVVDACRIGRGLGAILLQAYEDGWHPVSYWSKSLNKTEREYSPTELECKGMHDAILRYDVYLRYKEFEVITDHNALIYMVKAQTQHNNGRLMRYLMDLQPYCFSCAYRKGEEHSDADAVSRLLRQGEIPEYLTADDLDTTNGLITDEDFKIMEEIRQNKQKYIQRIIKAKLDKALRIQDQNFENIQKIAKISKVSIIDKEKIGYDCKTAMRMVKMCCTAYNLRKKQKVENNQEANAYIGGKNGIQNTRGKIVDHLAVRKDTRGRRMLENPQIDIKTKLAKTKEDGENKLKKLEEFIRERKRTIGHNSKIRLNDEEHKEEIDQEKYVFDNVYQNEKLALELKNTLEGKFYIDDENGRLYKVRDIQFDPDFKRVIGYRVDCSGRPPTKYDDYPYDVFGQMGLMQLVDLYNVDNSEIKWPGNDLKKISEYQLEDSEIQEIINEGVSVDGEMKEFEDWCFKYRDETYYLLGGEHKILVKEGRIPNGSKNSMKADRLIWQLVVPKILQPACMEIMHNGFGHPGVSRCLATARLRYTWINMRKDIKNYVSECRQCQLRKAYNCQTKVPIQEYPTCCLPLDRVHMDLTGELPMTEDGNKYLFVVKDAKTKFVWVFPIKNKKAETIVKIFMKEIVNKWGTPKLVVTDKGTEFKNALMEQVSRLLDIEKINTTPSNPRSNGSVEKHNNTMKDMLSFYVNVRHDDWDSHIDHITGLYNSTVSRSTGYTPYYLMFGRENARVNDVRLMDNVNQEEDLEEYTSKLVESLSLAWEITTVREHINATRENTNLNKKNKLLDYFIQLTPENMEEYTSNVTQLRRTLRDRAFREYQVGDRFFRKRHPVRAFKSAEEKEAYKIAMKLQPRYDGPYVIKEKLSAVLYLAEVEGEILKVHAINMKPEIATIEEHLEEFLRPKHKKFKRNENQLLDKNSAGGTTGKKKSPSQKENEDHELETENVSLKGRNSLKSRLICSRCVRRWQAFSYSNSMNQGGLENILKDLSESENYCQKCGQVKFEEIYDKDQNLYHYCEIDEGAELRLDPVSFKDEVDHIYANRCRIIQMAGFTEEQDKILKQITNGIKVKFGKYRLTY